MATNDPAVFHKLYGDRSPRVTYYKKDFVDYALMVLLTAVAAWLCYGPTHPLAIAAHGLCAFELYAFVARRGVEWKVPLLLRKPQDALFMLVYKIQNLHPLWLVAVAVLLLENVAIALTPQLPHRVEWMRTAGLWLFYIHLIGISVYRTLIFIDHLAKKELVREVLMETPWKRVIRPETNITLEILHAYATGLLTHIILLAPWYLVIQYANFSLLFLPVVAAVNLVVQKQWVRAVNAWFYRDHWLGHNSELEFVYLHGTHHDAIPSGMIAVAGNGFLEGLTRHTIGEPVPFFNPVIAFFMYMYEVKVDIDSHQYIPGMFPRMTKNVMYANQHSTHHYGQLEPYGFGINASVPGISEGYRKMLNKFMPDEMRNSIRLDEELTGFRWENPTYKKTLGLYEKYQKTSKAKTAQRATT